MDAGRGGRPAGRRAAVAAGLLLPHQRRQQRAQLRPGEQCRGHGLAPGLPGPAPVGQRPRHHGETSGGRRRHPRRAGRAGRPRAWSAPPGRRGGRRAAAPPCARAGCAAPRGSGGRGRRGPRARPGRRPPAPPPSRGRLAAARGRGRRCRRSRKGTSASRSTRGRSGRRRAHDGGLRLAALTTEVDRHEDGEVGDRQQGAGDLVAVDDEAGTDEEDDQHDDQAHQLAEPLRAGSALDERALHGHAVVGLVLEHAQDAVGAPGRTSSYVEMVSAAGSSPAATTRCSTCRSAGSAPGPDTLPVLTADPPATPPRRARARRRSRSGRPRAGRGAAPSRARPGVRCPRARSRSRGRGGHWAAPWSADVRWPGSVHGRTVPTPSRVTRRPAG